VSVGRDVALPENSDVIHLGFRFGTEPLAVTYFLWG
jgi:hypothetical protein